jgi:hypothetical protein
MADEVRHTDDVVVVRERNRVGVSLLPILVVALAMLSVVALYYTSGPAETPASNVRVEAPASPPITPPSN